MENFIINAAIGIIAIVGFFMYWGKASGVFKEGGLINEWWKNFKAAKKEEHLAKKEENNEEK